MQTKRWPLQEECFCTQLKELTYVKHSIANHSRKHSETLPFPPKKTRFNLLELFQSSLHLSHRYQLTVWWIPEPFNISHFLTYVKRSTSLSLLFKLHIFFNCCKIWSQLLLHNVFLNAHEKMHSNLLSSLFQTLSTSVVLLTHFDNVSCFHGKLGDFCFCTKNDKQSRLHWMKCEICNLHNVHACLCQMFCVSFN